MLIPKIKFLFNLKLIITREQIYMHKRYSKYASKNAIICYKICTYNNYNIIIIIILLFNY
jgi:hypothetical protein